MFKLVMSIVLIISCGCLGLYKSNTYRCRLNDLRSILDMLKTMQGEINFRRDTLPELFVRLSIKDNDISSKLLKDCLSNMNSNTSFNESWNMAVEEAIKYSHLNQSDKLLLYDLGSMLGKSSVNEQSNMLKLIELKFHQQIQNAEFEITTKAKMYSSLGFSIGIVAAVILI